MDDGYDNDEDDQHKIVRKLQVKFIDEGESSVESNEG